MPTINKAALFLCLLLAAPAWADGIYNPGAGGGGGSGCTVSGGSVNQILINNGSSGCSSNANAVANAGALALGSSGTAGSVTLGNATSGTIALQPVTGALGSITILLPASSGTVALTSQLASLPLSGANGGTGIANTGSTITLGASLATTGTSATTFALPSSGTPTYTFPAATATLTQTIASGSLALATSAIASAACSTAQTATATGTATTDIINATFNGDPTAATGYIPLTTGMLTIIAYPTSNTANFKVCNNTNASITPGAITLNWSVTR